MHLTYCQATTLSLFLFILQSNQESHEHLKYFRNVYCVMTNYSKDCLSCSISIQWITQLVSQILVHWIVIYQVDSAIRHLNNQGQGTLTSHKLINYCSCLQFSFLRPTGFFLSTQHSRNISSVHGFPSLTVNQGQVFNPWVAIACPYMG